MHVETEGKFSLGGSEYEIRKGKGRWDDQGKARRQGTSKPSKINS